MFTDVNGSDLNITVAPRHSTEQYLNDREILFIAITTGILGVAGFLENLVIICVIFTKRNTILLVPSNIFLLSLVCAEVLLCGVVLPLFIFQLVHQDFYIYFINAGKFIALATVGSLLSLTLNKFMSVKWHLRYLATMTVCRAFLVVVSVWTSASCLIVCVFISYMTGVVFLRQLLRYFLLIFFLLLFALNCYLLFKSRQHKRQIKSQLHVITGKSIVTREDLRKLKTVLVTSCTFGLGWLPMLLLALCVDRVTSPKKFHRILSYLVPFVAAAAVIDPIIYFHRVGLDQRSLYNFKQTLLRPVNFVVRTARNPFIVSQRVRNL